MKIMIEVSGGVVSNIAATGEVEIYLIDHDNIKAGYEAIPCLIEPMHPGEYLNTKEGGHVAIPGGSETPEFDECLKEALEPYHEEYMEVTA